MTRSRTMQPGRSIAIMLAFTAGCAQQPAPAAQPAAEPTQRTTAATKPAVVEPLTESEAILARSELTESASVKHVLIGWRDLASANGKTMDDRAKTRSKVDADTLVSELLKRAIAGDDFDALMLEHSEDWGSAKTGQAYPVTPDAGLVAPFKNLSLRLQVNEVGLVLSGYGWHIIKRVE